MPDSLCPPRKANEPTWMGRHFHPRVQLQSDSRYLRKLHREEAHRLLLHGIVTLEEEDLKVKERIWRVRLVLTPPDFLRIGPPSPPSLQQLAGRWYVRREVYGSNPLRPQQILRAYGFVPIHQDDQWAFIQSQVDAGADLAEIEVKR